MKRADEKSEAAAKVHGRAESVKAWERAFTQARQAWELEKEAQEERISNQQQVLEHARSSAEKAFKQQREILDARKDDIEEKARLLEVNIRKHQMQMATDRDQIQHEKVKVMEKLAKEEERAQASKIESKLTCAKMLEEKRVLAEKHQQRIATDLANLSEKKVT